MPGASSLAASRRREYTSAMATSCALGTSRSEEHTSELQSPYDLVCRLLLEKKKIIHSCLPSGSLYSACRLRCHLAWHAAPSFHAPESTSIYTLSLHDALPISSRSFMSSKRR